VPGKRQPQRDEPAFDAVRIRTFVAQRLQRGEHVDARDRVEQPSGILAHQCRQSVEQQRPRGGAETEPMLRNRWQRFEQRACASVRHFDEQRRRRRQPRMIGHVSPS
jgi:hypothetical protein